MPGFYQLPFLRMQIHLNCAEHRKRAPSLLVDVITNDASNFVCCLMSVWIRIAAPLLVVVLLVSGCADDDFVDDLSDTSYQLVDQDSNTVVFPDDFQGQALVVGYVYLQCPDICPLVTVNMRDLRNELDAPDDVAFITMTFDPQRDTPEALRSYREAYGLEDTDWTFLTGDPETVDALMDRLGVRVELSRGTYDDDDYLLDHSNQISLIDPEGRVTFHYGGSMTPTDILVEDLEPIRPTS